MAKKFSIAPLLVVPFIACGGSDSHTVTTVDSHVATDSGSGSGSATCHADASYGAVTFANQYGETDGSGSSGSDSHVEYFDGDLNGDTLFDSFQLALYAGYGGLTGSDVHTGMFQITGDDADYTTCGICGEIYADIGSDGNAASLYLAQSGTVNITSVTGTIAGSVSNLSFVNIDVGSNGQTIVDNCTSSITSGTFSIALTQGSAAANLVAPQRVTVKFDGAALHHRHH